MLAFGALLILRPHLATRLSQRNGANAAVGNQADRVKSSGAGRAHRGTRGAGGGVGRPPSGVGRLSRLVHVPGLAWSGMRLFRKDWDDHVPHAEEVARTPGFLGLRDEIIALADPRPDDMVVDLGAGTGLLTLAIARECRHVWALDISARMCEYLRTKGQSLGLENVDVATASAISLPLGDECAELVLSNYCLHHLREEDKRRALDEVLRVLAPGGRFVCGDMMFAATLRGARDRRIARAKIRSLLARGLPGLLRLTRGVIRQLGRERERPADAAWWEAALAEAGFADVDVRLLDHEGGIATARKSAGGESAGRTGSRPFVAAV